LGFVGYAIPGAFAEYCAMPAFKIGQYAAKIPAAVSYEVGATAEPLAVALYAVNQTQPKPQDSVVVIGLGIIGLCIIQILKARGVQQIIASGRRAGRLQLAKKCGASVVIDAAQEDAVKTVLEVTDTRKADIVYECAGNEVSFNQAMQMTHRGGTIDMVGLFEKPINWNPSMIAGNDLTLIGCGLRWDLPGAVKLLKKGLVSTTELITHRFPLAQIREAFLTQQKDPGAIKVMIDL
jgi:threonine dehydrogenase-like Zn-dependent dehydrogenase